MANTTATKSKKSGADYKLVIVESPSKAATIHNYLGSGYHVIASKGHVRDLPKSTLGVDIANHFQAKYINIRGKGPLIAELKKEAKHASKVFLATDPDREGEAISWHLATALGIPMEETHRITFNEVTKNTIKAAIKSPRQIDLDLVNSQQARRIVDRIVGYKLSPFLWKAIKPGLSAGRVQSAATRILVEREEEIRAFVPEEYWTIDAFLSDQGQKCKAKFFGDAAGNRIELHNQADADRVLQAINAQPFTVKNVKKSVRVKNPAPPFTTSTLQQEGSKKLGFQTQYIMRIAQELYEGVNLGSENGGIHGLITYMRTDSLRISAESQAAAKDLIVKKYGENAYPKTPRVYKIKANAQDAHEAIRPANPELEPEKIKKYLSSGQYRLYKLIWSRFIASQMASAELDTVSADIENSGYLFRASGYTVRFPGFMAVYDQGEDAEDDGEKTKLPELTVGKTLVTEQILPAQHYTEPPARYNEATLIKFLEEKGIGRPSTFSPIITTIIARGYVCRDGKSLKPTQLGEITTRLMKEYFPEIVDYQFTAQIEDQLDEIEDGETQMEQVLSGFYAGFEKELDEAEAAVSKMQIEVPVEETDLICEKCGSRMIVRSGRFGKFAACPNYPTCKNTKPLVAPEASVQAPPPPVDLKCELCGSDMVQRNGKFGSFYACSQYPKCKFTKQITKDIGVKCPLCGSKIVMKHAKNGKSVFYSCEAYPKCSFSSWDLPLNETCPKCGKMLFRKKGKNLAICHDPDCRYKREVEFTDEET